MKNLNDQEFLIQPRRSINALVVIDYIFKSIKKGRLQMQNQIVTALNITKTLIEDENWEAPNLEQSSYKQKVLYK